MPVERSTVDLSNYPDLVVIVLGMRLNRLRGIRRFLQLGPQIERSVAAAPDGLLHHQTFLFSLVPVHAGIRQYWRDYESLERWTRSGLHRAWWQQFLKDSGGTGFWHETYFRSGGFEAIYDDCPTPVGMQNFAPACPARGAMFSARHRAQYGGEPTTAPVVPELRLYDDAHQ